MGNRENRGNGLVNMREDGIGQGQGSGKERERTGVVWWQGGPKREQHANLARNGGRGKENSPEIFRIPSSR